MCVFFEYVFREVHLALAWLEELLLGFDKYFSHDCKIFLGE